MSKTKRREKKVKVCVSVSQPGSRRWRTVCKKLTKRQIAKLVGIPKGSKVMKVTTF